MTVIPLSLAIDADTYEAPYALGPIPLSTASRFDLPGLFHRIGFTRGAEIGVWKGGFSAALCRANPALQLLCVDPWLSYPGWVDTKNQGYALMAAAYAEAQERLAPLRATIWRQSSAEAARDVPDRSLDFVFIDGNHSYAAVTEDLTLWSQKVRSGGIVSGHDYRMFPTKPAIEVVRAVNDFTAAHAIAPWFVLGADTTPSFLWMVR